MPWITSLCSAVGLAILAATTPATATTATQSPADTAPSATLECPTGWLCAWNHDSSRRLATQVSIPDLRAVNMDNQINVLWNRTSVPWCAFEGAHYTGQSVRVGKSLSPAIPLQEEISSLLRGC
ncbi:peptidase inhibitor family I36 protein [Amycolatopsis sp. 195334CR]|uniref:peptidase inhibitor family I36 protein n=1 Tax=Amycolatopsis sp. 195334CR TaxID=2814588 RepID=UPI001A8DC363|nr:peptidase inhibitor family I36 protein [Amycolatopsis sp. 195334CR]MBN6040007.1 peptidase inhibitor family I36 protein [Amycolatopsis sp. 195334CR]